MLSEVLAFCRAGFEAEAARDIARIAAVADAIVEPRVVPASALVGARIHGPAPSLRRFTQAVIAVEPVFLRGVFLGNGPHRIAAPAPRGRPDRITPLVAAVESLRAHAPFSTAWIEHADTNEGKALSSLARSLHARLAAALQAAGLLDPAAASRPRLHVLLADGTSAWVGASDPAASSAWPMGIPRLRMPAGAPSRSTLKLAEAFVAFLGDEAPAVLHAGMRAVDLGAAPGGWTWQLARRGLRVTAVDNGALKGAVALDPLVTHVREDGLRYRPRRPVDWLTCDIVESPARIAALVGEWIASGAARHAIFNLKLPMKRRYDEVERCREIILQAVGRHGARARLRLRQLYHDREEVTGYLTRVA